MVYTTATLDIGSFNTRLTLTGNSGPRQRINVLPAGDIPQDHVPCFRAEADLLMALHGYTRTTDWTNEQGRGDVHTATIQPADR